YPKEQYEFLGARLGEPLKDFYMENNCSDGHVIVALANSTPVSSGGKMVELYFRQLMNEGEDISLISMLINEEDAAQYLPKSAKPDQYALSQNYPNPFNPTTQIRYQLPEAALVQLTIYNILGQEIRRLVDVKQNAGFYSMVWDGRNNAGLSVASGVYLYRLRAGSFVQTKKMIFLK
ncbi:MAG: T9SS type A sorting domain-containing protein, partial [Patescibacteria group bacterium]|nr:T9SS type A sorting domain-containing protein [Patescibacteria group bacterium]